MFLRDERNNDAMMTTIEEIVKDVAGAGEEMSRGGSGSDEDSVIVLSDDDEYTTDPSDHEARSALSMSQLRVLESCWRDWPFPSRDLVTSLVSNTGLSVANVTTWFIDKNKVEMERCKH